MSSTTAGCFLRTCHLMDGPQDGCALKHDKPYRHFHLPVAHCALTRSCRLSRAALNFSGKQLLGNRGILQTCIFARKNMPHVLFCFCFRGGSSTHCVNPGCWDDFGDGGTAPFCLRSRWTHEGLRQQLGLVTMRAAGVLRRADVSGA